MSTLLSTIGAWALVYVACAALMRAPHNRLRGALGTLILRGARRLLIATALPVAAAHWLLTRTATRGWRLQDSFERVWWLFRRQRAAVPRQGHAHRSGADLLAALLSMPERHPERVSPELLRTVKHLRRGALRAHTRTGLPEPLQMADAYFHRGRLETARQEVLAYLAHDPCHPAALELMREIEQAVRDSSGGT